ncbi:hypothetical protein SFOMI_3258 [Sphingobium fuliginis]|uniref:Uncharacterized protein n=1 Tax=Sphingobium fuliginis (strain ATCC 27551) TaxID=336203 RepID=A0A292ZGX9_SPHSA|nr:hypothetical protein SFOMI_3258 [Sphingobium fuliginis]
MLRCSIDAHLGSAGKIRKCNGFERDCRKLILMTARIMAGF